MIVTPLHAIEMEFPEPSKGSKVRLIAFYALCAWLAVVGAIVVVDHVINFIAAHI